MVILKQLKDEMRADLTAVKKKGLDRKTNHQDVTKAEIEEIFVLIKAMVGALKLERSVKEVAQPRPTRPPPPWGDKCNRGREFGVACTLEVGARGYKPTRGEEIRLLYACCTQQQKHCANDADELERYGLFKKSKANVAKLNALNPEPVFGIISMSKNPINGVDTVVRNGRGSNMTLDAHSFELVHQKTSSSTDDFYNHPEKNTDVYYAEMVDMFKRSHHHQVSHGEEECRRVMHRIRLLDC